MKILILSLLALAACGEKIPEREKPVYYRNVLNPNEVATTYKNEFNIAIHTGKGPAEDRYYAATYQLTDADTAKVYFEFSSGEYNGVDLKTLSNCGFTRAGSTLAFKCDGISARNFDHVDKL